MDTTILEEMGLSRREIAVYLALIRLGSSTTGPIVNSSGVSNAKIYEVLNKLIKKGLASYIFKGGVKHFQKTNPSSLLNFFDEKKWALQKLIEELDKIQNKEETEYEATVYESVRAIKSAFYSMFDYIGRNTSYSVFPLGEQLATEELIQFWSQVFRKRVQMKISLRTLPNIKLKKTFKRFYTYKHMKIRYTPQQLPTGVFIFKNHVLNVIWGEKPIAFLIKSKENYLRWQNFFEEQWAKSIA